MLFTGRGLWKDGMENCSVGSLTSSFIIHVKNLGPFTLLLSYLSIYLVFPPVSASIYIFIYMHVSSDRVVEPNSFINYSILMAWIYHSLAIFLHCEPSIYIKI